MRCPDQTSIFGYLQMSNDCVWSPPLGCSPSFAHGTVASTTQRVPARQQLLEEFEHFLGITLAQSYHYRLVYASDSVWATLMAKTKPWESVVSELSNEQQFLLQSSYLEHQIVR
jgi:hypothetical protein